jgi:hypothetical protein
MLKRIPKSDISIRPFKAYKEWSFDNNSTEIDLLEANISSSDLNLIPTGSLTGSTYPQNSIYGQLRAQFYSGNEDNPFTITGHKNNVYDNSDGSKDRFLSGSAKVISIPQIYVGEGIKKGSVSLIENGREFIDDSYGNLLASGSGTYINFTALDLEGSTFNFTDLNNVPYSATIDFYFIDMEEASFSASFGIDKFDCEIISMNNEEGVNGEGVIYVNNATFLQGNAGTLKLGNVFYNQGIITITRSVNSTLLGGWDLSFKSTKTIYENEYLLIVNQDEFNVSTNPSAVVNVGRETEFVTGSDGKIKQVVTNTGVNYIRKKTELSNGTFLDYRFSGSVPDRNNVWQYGGFEQGYTMTSNDSTGSFLTPMITTIGLYDDDLNLVAVAKLPQPIKSEHDMPVNFIVRFDT